MAKAKKAAKAAKKTKAAGGKKAKAPAADLGNLVVASKVRQYVRGKDVNMSGDVVEALNQTIISVLDKAVGRTEANKRKTLRPQDL